MPFNWKTVSWFGAACLVALGLFHGPSEGHHPLERFALANQFRYASGLAIPQVYARAPEEKLMVADWGGVPVASVIAYAERQPFAGQAKLKLQPRSVTRIRTLRDLAADRVMKVQEKLAIFEFDLLMDNIPVAKASRTVVVKGEKPFLIRDRNFPVSSGTPGQRAGVGFIAAREPGLKNAREIFRLLYPRAWASLTIDATPPPRLEYLPRADQAHLVWSYTVRSNDRGRPFLRRYWVSARGNPEILDYEDLIYYQKTPSAPGPETELPPRFLPRLFLLRPEMARPASPDQTAPIIPAPPRSAPQRPVPSLDPAPVPGNSEATNTLTGLVCGHVWDGSPFGSVSRRNLGGIEVRIARGHSGAAATTDKNGKYNLSTFRGHAAITASLGGPFCQIYNDRLPKGGSPVMSVTGNGDGTINLDFVAGMHEEEKLAQISAFYYVNQVHEFVKDFLPERPGKLASIATHVNIDNTCNAYYDSSDNSLNFFRSAPKGCPNTAYRDVVFHEYGHAVDDQFGGVLDGAYSEGFGDALCILQTRNPIVGQDFYGRGQHLRDASVVVKWPDAQKAEQHEAGRVFAGFTWELTRQLTARYQSQDKAFEVARQLVLGAAAQNPKDIPDAVRLSFYTDKLVYPQQAGESLHYAQLKAAAQSRLIPIPQEALAALRKPSSP